ncbi:Sedoheptulokinase [Orchesella cincta]|uniref:Sedoheptulokinase n=1 Tax=Orchesella cincta TaxID=48709 RepID=A0A1D2N414_ORCCI|nr:Sedoheptulokinase [Orchesella cincta]
MQSVYLLSVVILVSTVGTCLGQANLTCQPGLVQPVVNFTFDSYLGTWYAQKVYARLSEDAWPLEFRCLEVTPIRRHFLAEERFITYPNGTDIRTVALAYGHFSEQTEAIWNLVSFWDGELSEGNSVIVQTDFENWSIQFICKVTEHYKYETMFILTRERNADPDLLALLEVVVKNYGFAAENGSNTIMANWKYAVSIFIAAFLISSFCSSGCAASVLKQRFENNDFIYIGNMSSDSVENKAGTKSLSLYLSGPNDRKETQIAAAHQCRSLEGTLLYILNTVQFEEVKLAIHGLGEPFWTAGVYDGNLRSFVWLTNNREVNRDFIRGESRCSEANTLMGLTVQGSLSAYGLCGTRTESGLRYISNVPSECGTEGNKQDVPKICSTVHSVVTRLPRELLKRVVYIGVCGQMHGIVFWKSGQGWERNGDKIEPRVTSNLYTWQDSRCTKDFLSSLPTPDSHLSVNTGYGCATLFWMARNKPEKIEKFDRAATIQDFLVAMLCDLDEPVMSVQNAASWGYFNTEKKEWNKDILEAAGFPIRFLPKIEMGGHYAGRCSATAWLVVSEGTPVGAAMGDLQCSVSSTLARVDQAVLNISTSAQLTFVMPTGFHPKTALEEKSDETGNGCGICGDEESHVQYYPYFDGKYLAVAAAMTGGNSLAAFVRMLQNWAVTLGCNVPQSKIWEKLLAASANAEATSSSIEIIPTIFGERHAPEQNASVHNIDLGNISLGQVFRALCRGVIENLHRMMPSSMLTRAGVTSVIGSGSALSRNLTLQQEFLRIYNIESTFGKGGDAAFGAALAVLPNLQKQ